jgi:hypothetical protein
MASRIPSRRHHKPSKQAVVTLNGGDHSRGPWGSKQAKVEFQRLVGEWLASGGAPRVTDRNAITVAELVLAYRRFAREYSAPPSNEGAELLFDVLSTAYEGQCLIVTTNLPAHSWLAVWLQAGPRSGPGRPGRRGPAGTRTQMLGNPTFPCSLVGFSPIQPEKVLPPGKRIEPSWPSTPVDSAGNWTAIDVGTSLAGGPVPPLRQAVISPSSSSRRGSCWRW